MYLGEQGFGQHWRSEKITWLVDNEPVYFVTEWDSSSAKYPAPFDQPFHLLINLAVGGGFVGNINESTVFPQKLEVDFVRVHP
ncbi:MAG: family 16 glycosylhydrolase [Planctomycetota bacterium]|nr:family 16 glycosylhydrolase [Planctomycetota bacterium]